AIAEVGEAREVVAGGDAGDAERGAGGQAGLRPPSAAEERLQGVGLAAPAGGRVLAGEGDVVEVERAREDAEAITRGLEEGVDALVARREVGDHRDPREDRSEPGDHREEAGVDEGLAAGELDLPGAG